ncbi:MAG: ABC transporter ATP-binding protein [Firmicutes bacterium]|nr:ABC transporter ATP-binding protein [Bacillota bacterium]
MIYPIEIKNLCYRHKGKDVNVFKDINFKVNAKEILAIVGLSGCGKSTLCYCLSGVIPHVYKGSFNGEVLIDGKKTTNMKLSNISINVGIVFQNPDMQLFMPTVEDEIAFGPENLCLSKEKISKRIDYALERVGMKKHRYSNPNNLSGGEKQLIALASVLSLKPRVIIFDETMAQIDDKGKKRIKSVIKGLKEEGKSVIMVEHDLENLDIADRVLHLHDGKLKKFSGKL